MGLVGTKLVVTGRSRFLGRHVVQALQARGVADVVAPQNAL